MNDERYLVRIPSVKPPVIEFILGTPGPITIKRRKYFTTIPRRRLLTRLWTKQSSYIDEIRHANASAHKGSVS
jgi:hypothetical protein